MAVTNPVVCAMVVAIVAVLALAAPQGLNREKLKQKRDQFQREVCRDLSFSQQECRSKFFSCSNVRQSMNPFENPSELVRTCANENNIPLSALKRHRDSSQTIDEIIDTIKANGNGDKAKDMKICVFTKQGLANDGVLDVTALKNDTISKIQASVTDLTLQATVLGALDTCPQPTIDNLKDYRKCIVQTCINNV